MDAPRTIVLFHVLSWTFREKISESLSATRVFSSLFSATMESSCASILVSFAVMVENSPRRLLTISSRSFFERAMVVRTGDRRSRAMGEDDVDTPRIGETAGWW